jgi:hypothetical protein
MEGYNISKPFSKRPIGRLITRSVDIASAELVSSIEGHLVGSDIIGSSNATSRRKITSTTRPDSNVSGNNSWTSVSEKCNRRFLQYVSRLEIILLGYKKSIFDEDTINAFRECIVWDHKESNNEKVKIAKVTSLVTFALKQAGFPSVQAFFVDFQVSTKTYANILPISILRGLSFIFQKEPTTSLTMQNIATIRNRCGRVNFLEINIIPQVPQYEFLAESMLDAPTVQPVWNFVDGKIEFGDVATNDVATNDVATNDVATNDVATNDVATNDVATNDVATNDVATNDVATNDVATNDVATNDVATNDVDTRFSFARIVASHSVSMNTTSRPTTSRPTTSRPTTSRPTTSRPTTSRPTRDTDGIMNYLRLLEALLTQFRTSENKSYDDREFKALGEHRLDFAGIKEEAARSVEYPNASELIASLNYNELFPNKVLNKIFNARELYLLYNYLSFIVGYLDDIESNFNLDMILNVSEQITQMTRSKIQVVKQEDAKKWKDAQGRERSAMTFEGALAQVGLSISLLDGVDVESIRQRNRLNHRCFGELVLRRIRACCRGINDTEEEKEFLLLPEELLHEIIDITMYSLKQMRSIMWDTYGVIPDYIQEINENTSFDQVVRALAKCLNILRRNLKENTQMKCNHWVDSEGVSVDYLPKDTEQVREGVCVWYDLGDEMTAHCFTPKRISATREAKKRLDMYDAAGDRFGGTDELDWENFNEAVFLSNFCHSANACMAVVSGQQYAITNNGRKIYLLDSNPETNYFKMVDISNHFKWQLRDGRVSIRKIIGEVRFERREVEVSHTTLPVHTDLFHSTPHDRRIQWLNVINYASSKFSSRCKKFTTLVTNPEYHTQHVRDMLASEVEQRQEQADAIVERALQQHKHHLLALEDRKRHLELENGNSNVDSANIAGTSKEDYKHRNKSLDQLCKLLLHKCKEFDIPYTYINLKEESDDGSPVFLKKVYAIKKSTGKRFKHVHGLSADPKEKDKWIEVMEIVSAIEKKADNYLQRNFSKWLSNKNALERLRDQIHREAVEEDDDDDIDDDDVDDDVM